MLDKKQVSIYFRKFLRLLINKKSLFFVLEAILLPFIISIAFNANEVFDKYHITRTSSIMFISAALWIGLFNSVTSICNERKVIKFEYQIKGLSLPSYVTARVLTELVQLLFSNFLQSLDEKIPFLVWISHATITRWGTTAFFRIANMNNMVPSQGHTDWQVYQKDGVGTYAYDLLEILGNWGVLLAFAVLFIVATSLVLTSVRKDAR